MSGDEDDRDFAEAMRGVVPLAGRDKLRPRPEAAGKAPQPTAPPPRRFVAERAGDDVFARAEDVSRKQLAELRAGRVDADREVDLHGLHAPAARRELLAAIEQARSDGLRCLLVIHGVGHHSETGPVLKRALPEWLQEDAVAAAVLAFATAPVGGSGAGATYVLLRRSRT